MAEGNGREELEKHCQVAIKDGKKRELRRRYTFISKSTRLFPHVLLQLILLCLLKENET